MDQATLTHQSLLRNFRECRQNPGLDCHLGLRAGRDPEKTSQLEPKPALASTDSQRLLSEKTPIEQALSASTRDEFNPESCEQLTLFTNVGTLLYVTQ